MDPQSPDRRRPVYAAGAVSTAALVFVAVLAGCSGAGSSRNEGGATGSATSASCPAMSNCAGTGAAPGATAHASFPPGPVNTDPGYTPRILFMAGDATDASAEARDRQHNYLPPVSNPLPALWQPAGWYASVGRELGSPMAFSTLPDVDHGDTWEGVEIPIPGGGKALVSVTVLPNGRVRSFQCAAEGFDPASTSARAIVLKTLRQCATADFPGSEPAEVQAWISTQSDYCFNDLTRLAAGEMVRGATPIFGAAVYDLSGDMTGNTKQLVLDVYGSHP